MDKNEEQRLHDVWREAMKLKNTHWMRCVIWTDEDLAKYHELNQEADRCYFEWVAYKRGTTPKEEAQKAYSSMHSRFD